MERETEARGEIVAEEASFFAMNSLRLRSLRLCCEGDILLAFLVFSSGCLVSRKKENDFALKLREKEIPFSVIILQKSKHFSARKAGSAGVDTLWHYGEPQVHNVRQTITLL